METISGIVEKIDDKHYILIDVGEEKIKLPISEDKPNEVKSAFNKLITRIKDGEFQIQLDYIGDDLISQVSNEYIKQLNREIKEVYGEMENYGLINDQSKE
ncbi:hypothetical protein CA11_43470 [Gimesia maris]|uniref:hypothetical protein n=1 Tax=Gimesia maris TaxID=122 RepID=UPI001187F530|nr:hypothetical protein [Gimesia maris]QDU16515.1 hypothetical protein CA11_43470 [Gimesia maris]